MVKACLPGRPVDIPHTRKVLNFRPSKLESFLSNLRRKKHCCHFYFTVHVMTYLQKFYCLSSQFRQEALCIVPVFHAICLTKVLCLHSLQERRDVLPGVLHILNTNLQNESGNGQEKCRLKVIRFLLHASEIRQLNLSKYLAELVKTDYY